MVTQAPEYVPEAAPWMDQRTRDRGAVNINDIYWKRSDKEANPGWILVGPSAEKGSDGRPLTLQAESWMRKGRTPLLEYSYTDRRYKNGDRHTIETAADRLNTEWRWFWLFKNGGAHLFPIEQIVTYHWHIKPPYGLPKDVFPQLREWEVPDPRWCQACAGTRAPFNSDEQLVQHAMIAHRLDLQQARDMVKFASEPPAGSLGLQIRRRVQQQEQEHEAAGEFPATKPSPDQPQPSRFICNYCGEFFDKQQGLQMHERRWCKAKPQPEGASGGQSDQAPVDPVTEE